MIRWVCMCLGFGLFAPTASAVEGMAWKWEDSRRFLLIADVNAPEFLWFQAELNHQARVFNWRTNLVVDCSGEAAGKKAHYVSCKIEDVSIQAQPLPGDTEAMAPVLEDLDQKLTGAMLNLELTNDGRVRSVDLEGINRRHRRLNQIVETMRLVLTRSVAVLDLQLPKKGTDGGSGQWVQKQTLVTAFPSSLGTLGSVKTVHEIKTDDGDSIVLATSGKGLAGSGRTIQVNGQEQVANMYDVQYAGEATFDLKDGSLLAREYQMRGTPTASSEMSGAWQGQPYLQYAKLMRLDKGEKPNLGESRIIESK